MQMRKSTLKKWGFGVGGVLAGPILLAAVAVFMLTNRTVNRIYGGETQVVDVEGSS